MASKPVVDEMANLVRKEVITFNTLVENYAKTTTVPGTDRWAEIQRRLRLIKLACDGKDVIKAWDHVATLVETGVDRDRWAAAVNAEMQAAAAAEGLATGLAGTYALIRCGATHNNMGFIT